MVIPDGDDCFVGFSGSMAAGSLASASGGAPSSTASVAGAANSSCFEGSLPSSLSTPSKSATFSSSSSGFGGRGLRSNDADFLRRSSTDRFCHFPLELWPLCARASARHPSGTERVMQSGVKHLAHPCHNEGVHGIALDECAKVTLDGLDARQQNPGRRGVFGPQTGSSCPSSEGFQSAFQNVLPLFLCQRTRRLP